MPILRTGHYDLQSGPVDFSMEDLHAAVSAFEHDPAVLAPRLRLEGYGQAHLNGDGIAVEAAGGTGGPSVGWCDGLAVEGNTLYADWHVPAEIAANMDWAYPSRSIEGIHGYTTATGQTHAFMLTGCLLLGTSWPGVTTLPDFAEVQAEFQAEVAAGNIVTASFATATGDEAKPLDKAEQVARLSVTARAPKPARERLTQAGMNVSDIRMRWYGAEEHGDLDLPESYDYFSWYVTEVRADDDGSLYALVIDEATGQFWRFDVASIDGAEVSFAAPAEVMFEVIPVTAQAARPRPALARFNERPTPTSAASTTHQEDDPMTDAQRRALATSLGLDPETATVEHIDTKIADPTAQTGVEVVLEPEATDGTAPVADAEAELVAASGRTTTISRDKLAELERDAAAGAAARASQIEAERTATVKAALDARKITPAEAGLARNDDGSWVDGWRKDMDEAPEVTARALTRLASGKLPASRASSVAPQVDGADKANSENRALAAMGLPTTKKES